MTDAGPKSLPWQPNAIWTAVNQRAHVLVPLVLFVFALLYYASYVRSGLNLGGEGGTAAVVAMRLMDGQRPIVDTFLGYNVLWFFPVAWLFEITGPNYLALRWFFFAFCIASGFLVYWTVLRYTAHAWFSAIPAVLVILIPGMIFRNYMPFLGILNAYLLTSAWIVPHRSPLRVIAWAVAAGAGLGITFLFRIDLGIFNSMIFAGLALLFPWGYRGEFRRRAVTAAIAAPAGVAMLVVVHLPFLWDASKRDYREAFVGQYASWGAMVASEFRHWKDSFKTAAPPASATATAPGGASSAPAPTQAPTAEAPQADTWENRGALARAPLADIWSTGVDWHDRSLAISTYVPIFLSVPIVAVGGILLLAGLWRRDPEAKFRTLFPLTVLGCSLTLFPQYYFFRPDTVHIAEMMVPFLAALAVVIWASLRFARSRRGPARYPAVGFAIVCAVFAGIYVSHAMPKASAGTIAARKKATHSFVALNGVDVLVRRREAAWLNALQAAIINHSIPGDYVLCLPYSPTINFMADRPSPLHNLYVDNATAGDFFDGIFEETMEDDPPAVVVVDQRAINKTEDSRFRNWAPQQYQWLRDNYIYVGRYFRNEVFVRPDRIRVNKPSESVEPSD